MARKVKLKKYRYRTRSGKVVYKTRRQIAAHRRAKKKGGRRRAYRRAEKKPKLAFVTKDGRTIMRTQAQIDAIKAFTDRNKGRGKGANLSTKPCELENVCMMKPLKKKGPGGKWEKTGKFGPQYYDSVSKSGRHFKSHVCRKGHGSSRCGARPQLFSTKTGKTVKKDKNVKYMKSLTKSEYVDSWRPKYARRGRKKMISSKLNQDIYDEMNRGPQVGGVPPLQQADAIQEVFDEAKQGKAQRGKLSTVSPAPAKAPVKAPAKEQAKYAAPQLTTEEMREMGLDQPTPQVGRIAAYRRARRRVKVRRGKRGARFRMRRSKKTGRYYKQYL